MSHPPTFTDALTSLRAAAPESTEPPVAWYRREWWLVSLLASFLPIALGLIAQPPLRAALLIAGGVLIAIGLVLLARHEAASGRKPG